jgi:hypothetical protein
MFMKLLLTLLVIAGAVVAVKLRNRPPPVAAISAPACSERPKSPLPRIAAYGLVLISLIGVGFYFFHQWRDAYQMVSVRVIDTRSGNAVVYEAYKGDVEGRSFRTVDGRIVTLAEVERLELGVK